MKDAKQKFLDMKDTPEGAAVCNRFFRIAYGFMMRGEKIGAKAIAERLRWHYRVAKRRGKDGKPIPFSYKICNTHVAHMARWCCAKDERFLEVFSLKGYADLTGYIPEDEQMGFDLNYS